jgi:UDP-N-acetylglucosamine:LPS N-acetylglucosamine transferase
MIEEAELTPQRLLQELIRLLKDSEGLAEMAQKARALAHADAAASIAALIEHFRG